MNANSFDDITPIIESVASEYGRRYAHYGYDREDVSQALHLWIFDHPDKVTEVLEMDARDSDRMLARILRNEAHDLGEDAKAQHLGYSRDDLVFYSKAMVRELLPSMFDDEAWTHPETSDVETERKHRSAPAEGGNWVATLADVSRAYDSLEHEDRDLLAAFHRDEYSNKLLSEIHGITEQTMSYRHDRAVKRLVDALGGPRARPQHDEDCEHPPRYVGQRYAISNANARSIQSSYYDE